MLVQSLLCVRNGALHSEQEGMRPDCMISTPQGYRRGENPANSHGPKEASDVSAGSSEEKSISRLGAGRVRETAFEEGGQFALGESSPLIRKECVTRGHIRLCHSGDG